MSDARRRWHDDIIRFQIARIELVLNRAAQEAAAYVVRQAVDTLMAADAPALPV